MSFISSYSSLPLLFWLPGAQRLPTDEVAVHMGAPYAGWLRCGMPSPRGLRAWPWLPHLPQHWGSHKDFLMDLDLFSQLHLTTFLGELPWLEPLLGTAEISLTFWGAHACRTQLGGKCPASVTENSFFCFAFSIFFTKQLQKIWF